MKESKLIKGVVATVAVIAFAVPAVSSASELKGRAEKVTYSDLNPDKESGAEILYRRLQQASKRVCGVESMKNAGGIRAVSELGERPLDHRKITAVGAGRWCGGGLDHDPGSRR